MSAFQNFSILGTAFQFLRMLCVHLAVCAVHGIPYLLTWNFRHIANAEVRRVLGGVCARAGYDFPTICTPDELMKGEL